MSGLTERLSEIYQCQFNDIMNNTDETPVALYQKVAKFCVNMSNTAMNDEELAFWNEKETECINTAKNLLVSVPKAVSNIEEFKTEYKFSGSEERTLYQRFVDNQRTQNKWMYYTVTDSDFNYKNEAGQYFFDMNESVKERFDEITNYEYIVVDKDFLINNNLSVETPVGKRYVLYVDSEDFKESTVAETGSEMSVIHDGCRVFKNYESLAEFVEDRLKHRAIYVMSDGAFNALRYLISSIEIVKCPNLETPENYELIRHDFEKYSNFLSFCKSNIDTYTRTEKVIEEIKENPEFFSEYIRFKQVTKSTQIVDKNIVYELHKITKPSAIINVFRWGRKTKNDQNARFIQVQNVLLTLDEKLKLVSVDVQDDDFTLSNHTDYVIHERLRSNISITETDKENFNPATIEALQKLIQIQIRTK